MVELHAKKKTKIVNHKIKLLYNFVISVLIIVHNFRTFTKPKDLKLCLNQKT